MRSAAKAGFMEKLASIKAAADSAATPGMRQKVPTFGFGRARSATPNAERHTGVQAWCKCTADVQGSTCGCC
jgi:hypothetical protein